MTNQVGMPRMDLGMVSSVFANEPMEDLSEGIRSALSTLSILGNVFGIRYRKLRYELDASLQRQIEVVILKGAKTTSKTFWDGPYTPNSDLPPDCWSSNGRVPDDSVEVKQAQSCSMCPHDVFKTLPTGMKGKECTDGKRVAIVPALDMENDAFGGPMLLRVPAGSLGALEMYGKDFKKVGIPFYAYTTIISFVPGTTTKLAFTPGRPITDEEALIIQKHRKDDRTSRIINEEIIPEDEAQTRTAPTASSPPPAAAAGAVTAPTQAPSPARPMVQQQAAPIVTPGVRTAEAIATAAEPMVAVVTGSPLASPLAAKVQPVQSVQGTSAIGSALARPATPPPSQRTVNAPTQVEEVADTASLPNEVDSLFNSLIVG
jgi:hypothetical protein